MVCQNVLGGSSMPYMRKFDTMNTYSQFGTPQTLSKGIIGHKMEDEHGGVTIPMFMSTVEGRGYAGKFIEDLQNNYRMVCFPATINVILEQMLVRRGFIKKWQYVHCLKDHTDVFIWKKPKK
jgi:hypothetical protein